VKSNEITMGRFVSLSATAACAVLFTAADAHALGPLDIELAGRVGGGIETSGDPTGPFGPGLGGRVGATISGTGVYGGLTFDYYFGGSQQAGGVSVQQHAVLYGLEGGYGVQLANILTLRGQLAFGNLAYTAGSYDKSGIYVEPGITALVFLRSLILGVDAGVVFLPGFSPMGPLPNTPGPALLLHGQVGWRF
jgi:hypothetical protein